MNATLTEQAILLRKQAEQWVLQALARLGQEFDFGTLGLSIPTGLTPDGFLFLNPKRLKLFESFYLSFPFLFYELFPQVPLEHYQTLSLSIDLYLGYLGVMDTIIDDKVMLEPNADFWLTSVHQEAMTLLASLFPRDSSLWPYFAQCRRENTHAMVLERVKHTHRLIPYSEEEMILIAAGKCALAKAGIVALALLAHKEPAPDHLLASCEAWYVGLDLLDDVKDWRPDYFKHMYSPLLTQVILDHQLAEAVEANPRLDANVIGSLIYSGGYAQATVEQARDFFKLALRYAQEVPCHGWQTAITEMLHECQTASVSIREKLKDIHQKQRSSDSKTIPGSQPAVEPGWQIQTPYESFAIKSTDGINNPVQDYLTAHGEQLSDFWRVTGTAADVARARLLEYADRQPAWAPPSAAVAEVSDLVLRRCREFASLPGPFQIYFWMSGTETDARAFLRDGTIHCGIALDQWLYPLDAPALDPSVSSAQLAQFIRIGVAREYGRALRLIHLPESANLLDAICLEGFALAFAQEVCSDIALHRLFNLPAGTLSWFECNKQYLWQEAQLFLAGSSKSAIDSYLGRDLNNSRDRSAIHRLPLGGLLGYDMISNYRQRSGKQAWDALARRPALAILNKGETMNISGVISEYRPVHSD